MTDAQIHAAPTAHGFRPAVRHPQSCIAPTLPAPSHAAYSSPYPFHTSRRASPGIDRYSKQNGSIRTGRHLQSNMLRALSPRPNPGRRSATAFHPSRTQPAALPHRPSSAQMRQSPPAHATNSNVDRTSKLHRAPYAQNKGSVHAPPLAHERCQQPNPRGGQPPRAYSLTLNTASSMLSLPLMPSASRFGRCASSGNITMKSPSRISTRAPSPSAKNSMSCSGS